MWPAIIAERSSASPRGCGRRRSTAGRRAAARPRRGWHRQDKGRKERAHHGHLAIQPEAERRPNGAKPLALYVHWPFCVSKCPYCDFNSHVRASIDQEAWRDALLADLAHEAALLPGPRLASIFFGGGTPSLMEPATVEAVIAAARAIGRSTDDIEITLEANPNSAEAARFADLARAGRQPHQPRPAELRRRSRSPSSAAPIRPARACARWRPRNRRFDRVSFDLIYALPGDTSEAGRQHRSTARLASAPSISRSTS